MKAVRVLAVVAFAAGVAVEASGAHPGGWGFASNAGMVLAIVLWVLSGLTTTSQIRLGRR